MIRARSILAHDDVQPAQKSRARFANALRVGCARRARRQHRDADPQRRHGRSRGPGDAATGARLGDRRVGSAGDQRSMGRAARPAVAAATPAGRRSQHPPAGRLGADQRRDAAEGRHRRGDRAGEDVFDREAPGVRERGAGCGAERTRGADRANPKAEIPRLRRAKQVRIHKWVSSPKPSTSSKARCKKTAAVLNTDVRTLFVPGRQIDDAFLDEMEEKFIRADMGVKRVEKLEGRSARALAAGEDPQRRRGRDASSANQLLAMFPAEDRELKFAATRADGDPRRRRQRRGQDDQHRQARVAAEDADEQEGDGLRQRHVPRRGRRSAHRSGPSASASRSSSTRRAPTPPPSRTTRARRPRRAASTC